jgi:hypothetical protein
MKINIVVAHALIVLFFTLIVTPAHRIAFHNSLNFGMTIPVEYIVPPLPIVIMSIDNRIFFDDFSFFKEPGPVYTAEVYKEHFQDISNPTPITNFYDSIGWGITYIS